MLENEQFVGAFVKLPIGIFERLAVAAENHAARVSRWADTTTIDGTVAAIVDWLDDLEQTRTMPTPHAEAGDLLVKLGRAEFWTFTMHGWRELAPIELLKVSDVENAVDRGGEFTSRQVPTEQPHSVAYETRYRPSGAEPEEGYGRQRFFGRGVVEDELDRMRKPLADYAEASAGGKHDEQADRPPCPACQAKAAADTLEEAAMILESIGGDAWSTEEIVAAACGMRETLKTLGIA